MDLVNVLLLMTRIGRASVEWEEWLPLHQKAYSDNKEGYQKKKIGLFSDWIQKYA